MIFWKIKTTSPKTHCQTLTQRLDLALPPTADQAKGTLILNKKRKYKLAGKVMTKK